MNISFSIIIVIIMLNRLGASFQTKDVEAWLVESKWKFGSKICEKVWYEEGRAMNDVFDVTRITNFN